ncbi:MAG: hypothetical protein KAT77_05565 [Nanoarchaeota archaeon]|nr:hypothetical protein [Nanoarchaeota archaeon]
MRYIIILLLVLVVLTGCQGNEVVSELESKSLMMNFTADNPIRKYNVLVYSNKDYSWSLSNHYEVIGSDEGKLSEESFNQVTMELEKSGFFSEFNECKEMVFKITGGESYWIYFKDGTREKQIDPGDYTNYDNEAERYCIQWEPTNKMLRLLDPDKVIFETRYDPEEKEEEEEEEEMPEFEITEGITVKLVEISGGGFVEAAGYYEGTLKLRGVGDDEEYTIFACSKSWDWVKQDGCYKFDKSEVDKNVDNHKFSAELSGCFVGRLAETSC